jgi:hypothetical protein
MMSTTRYWVVGGEFRSPEFEALIDGTGKICGAFRNPLRRRKRLAHRIRTTPLELLHALYRARGEHRRSGHR